MISERARQSLNAMVMLGMRSALVGADDVVTRLETVPDIHPVREAEVLMFSVASYRFRLMILIYFTRDEATRAHFAGLARMAPATMDAQAFTDVISERGNLCCGTFNRELGRVYPHIGMSTPNIIQSRCAEHLGLMKYGHLQHFALQLQSGVHFHVSLCVCETEALDFAAPAPAEPESTGELEFF